MSESRRIATTPTAAAELAEALAVVKAEMPIREWAYFAKVHAPSLRVILAFVDEPIAKMGCEDTRLSKHSREMLAELRLLERTLSLATDPATREMFFLQGTGETAISRIQALIEKATQP